MNIIATTVFIPRSFFKNIHIIMFENWHGINQMGLSASLADYKNKQYFTNMKMTPKFSRLNKRKFKR